MDGLKKLALVCSRRIEEAEQYFATIAETYSGPLLEEAERWKFAAIQSAEMDAVRIDEAICSDSESPLTLSVPVDLNYLQALATLEPISKTSSYQKMFTKLAAQNDAVQCKLLLHPYFNVDPFIFHYASFRLAISQGYADIVRLYFDLPDFTVEMVPNTRFLILGALKREVNMLPILAIPQIISFCKAEGLHKNSQVLKQICDSGDAALLRHYFSLESLHDYRFWNEVNLNFEMLCVIDEVEGANVIPLAFKNDFAKKNALPFTLDQYYHFLNGKPTPLLYDALNYTNNIYASAKRLDNTTCCELLFTLQRFIINALLERGVVHTYILEFMRTLALELRLLPELERMAADSSFNFGYSDSYLLREYVSAGDEEMVKILLKSPAVDPAALDNEALMLAIKYRNFGMASLLLHHPSVDPSARDNLVLYTAIQNGMIKFALHLLQDPRVRPDRRIFNAAIVAGGLHGHPVEFMRKLLVRFAD